MRTTEPRSQDMDVERREIQNSLLLSAIMTLWLVCVAAARQPWAPLVTPESLRVAAEREPKSRAGRGPRQRDARLRPRAKTCDCGWLRI